MARNSTQGVHRDRKILFAIKRADAEPLTRADLQYDFLKSIFDDDQVVFTDPFQTLGGKPPGSKVTFRDLYVNALVNSPRSSKNIKDKMVDTPEFGNDFAKISLLANVGRINTTMAFFPEMRTALRTYHPVPSLQMTDDNLQDAPRIKNTLKFVRTPREKDSNNVPLNPSDVVMEQHAGHIPSTSAVSLIFVLANNFVTIRNFFDGVDFLDLFLPTEYTAKSRAQVFLWLLFHYLESPSQPNPFADDYARSHPAKAPRLVPMTPEEKEEENKDTPEEIEYGERMAEQRKKFLNPSPVDVTGGAPNSEMMAVDEVESQTASGAATPVRTEKKGGTVVRLKMKQQRESSVAADSGDGEMSTRARATETLSHKTSHQRLQPDHPHQPAAGEPYPRFHTIQPAPGPSGRMDTAEFSVSAPVPTKPKRQRRSKAAATNGNARLAHGARENRRIEPVHYVVLPPEPERTMLEHAFHIVNTIDPLAESDEENADEHVRRDYIQRLKTLNRLRGKSPTPEPEPVPQVAKEFFSFSYER